MEVTFTRLPDKETSGAHRFKEVYDAETGFPQVGSLYLKKPTWAALGRPDTVTITIKAG